MNKNVISTYSDDGVFIVLNKDEALGFALRGTKVLGTVYLGTLEDQVKRDSVITLEAAKKIYNQIIIAGMPMCIYHHSDDVPPMNTIPDVIHEIRRGWGDDPGAEAMIAALQSYAESLKHTDKLPIRDIEPDKNKEERGGHAR